VDPMNLPEDLSTFSDAELQEIKAKLAERAEEIAAAEQLSDADLIEIEALGDINVTIDNELASRSEIAAAAKDRVEAALDKFRSEPLAADDAEEAVEELAEESAPADEATELAEEATELAVEVEESTEELAVTDDDATIETESDATVNEEVTPNAAALATARPAALAPRANENAASFQATGFSVDPEGTKYEDPMELATSIAKKRQGMTHVPAGVKDDYVRLASLNKGFEDGKMMGSDASRNGSILDAAGREATALVASGAICTQLETNYEQITLGAPLDAPLASALPTVGASKGGLRFRPYSKANIIAALEGIGHITYGPGAGACPTGMGPGSISTMPIGGNSTGGTDGELSDDNLKPCVELTCPPEDECYVEAFSQCLKVDNLQYRVDPGLVAEFQRDLAQAYTAVKEAWILAYLQGNATDMPVTGLNGTPGVLYAIEQAAASYRSAHFMASNATIQAFIERGELDHLKLDVAMACGLGLDPFAVMSMTEADLAAELRKRNIEPVFYTDPAKLGGAIQAPAVPTGTVDVIMGAPGAVVMLDGGTLDLGIVRDSALNGTNDLQIFQEEWLGLCNRGIELIELQIDAGCLGERQACGDLCVTTP